MDLETVDRLLTTTRTVRRRLDFSRSVPASTLLECIDVAVQAPIGGNVPKYHFVVATDADVRSEIGAVYRDAVLNTYLPARQEVEPFYASRESGFMASLVFLAEHMGEAPALIVPCTEGRPDASNEVATASLYANVYPSMWSLMLALRARRVGCAWTTLHLIHEKKVREILEIPENVTQAGLLAVAYYTGEDFRPARRVPARERTYWNRWGVASD